jgi:hypothetical protein
MKQRRLCCALLMGFALTLGGCATNQSYDYTAFRESKPRSIVVLPPLNLSPDVRASYSMLATVTRPLAESGYYVLPVALVDQTFRENGVTEPGEMHQVPPAKLAEIFGADAALYISIEEYGAKYMIVSSEVIVAASARLIDTRSGQLLWEGKARASSAENQDASGGLASLLIKALLSQVINSIGDQGYPVARMTSFRLLSARQGGLLPGPRSPDYAKVVGQ